MATTAWSGAIEIEAATWDGDVASDESLGVNIVGLSRFSRTEYFFGAGAAIHQLDFEQGGDDDVLGVNFHVGVDVFLGDNLSVYGNGRVDLLEDVSDSDLDPLRRRASPDRSRPTVQVLGPPALGHHGPFSQRLTPPTPELPPAAKVDTKTRWARGRAPPWNGTRPSSGSTSRKPGVAANGAPPPCGGSQASMAPTSVEPPCSPV